MTTKVSSQHRGPTDEPQAGNGGRSDQPNPARLVWEQINNWVHVSEGGRYRLERFVPGTIRDIDLTREGPDRYRVLKCHSYWCYEFAPTEEDFDVAKRCCEADAVNA